VDAFSTSASSRLGATVNPKREAIIYQQDRASLFPAYAMV